MGRVAREFVDAVNKSQEEPIKPLVYRPRDAAKLLGVSQSTVYELIAGGRLHAKKLGGATVIRRQAIDDMLDALPDAEVTKAAQASIR